MHLTCSHCGVRTPRLTLDQRRCPPCEARVNTQIAQDEARRTRFPRAVDLTGLRAA